MVGERDLMKIFEMGRVVCWVDYVIFILDNFVNDDFKMLIVELVKGVMYNNYIEFDDCVEGIRYVIDIVELGDIVVLVLKGWEFY